MLIALIMQYFNSTYLSSNWKVVPFNHFQLITSPLPPASGNHKNDLVLHDFVCLFALKYNWPATLWWFIALYNHGGSLFLYVKKMTTTRSQVAIHHTKILHYYWPCSPLHLIPATPLFLNWKFVLLALTYSRLLPLPPPLANCLLVLYPSSGLLC